MRGGGIGMRQVMSCLSIGSGLIDEDSCVIC